MTASVVEVIGRHLSFARVLPLTSDVPVVLPPDLPEHPDTILAMPVVLRGDPVLPPYFSFQFEPKDGSGILIHAAYVQRTSPPLSTGLQLRASRAPDGQWQITTIAGYTTR